MEPTPHLPQHSWLYRRFVLPVLALLRLGASPERLAWSLALGLVVGINPLLGSTTLLCLVLAFIFRLNIAASQIANHLVYPLEVLLLIPFLRLGARAFHTPPIPLSPSQLLHEARAHPLRLSQELWVWESHALIVWSAVALIAAPLFALALTPLLQRLERRVISRQYPLIPEPAPDLDCN